LARSQAKIGLLIPGHGTAGLCGPSTAAHTGPTAGEINPRFSKAGLVTRVPRLSTAIEENVLYPLGAHRTASLFVATLYLASPRSAANEDFHDHFRGTFGPVPNKLPQSCYECVHSLMHLLTWKAVGSPPSLRRDAGGRGPAHVAEAQGADFATVWSVAE
jgi:hypothetical protein